MDLPGRAAKRFLKRYQPLDKGVRMRGSRTKMGVGCGCGQRNVNVRMHACLSACEGGLQLAADGRAAALPDTSCLQLVSM